MRRPKESSGVCMIALDSWVPVSKLNFEKPLRVCLPLCRVLWIESNALTPKLEWVDVLDIWGAANIWMLLKIHSAVPPQDRVQILALKCPSECPS